MQHKSRTNKRTFLPSTIHFCSQMVFKKTFRLNCTQPCCKPFQCR